MALLIGAVSPPFPADHRLQAVASVFDCGLDRVASQRGQDGHHCVRYRDHRTFPLCWTLTEYVDATGLNSAADRRCRGEN